MNVKRVLLYN